MRSTFKTLPPAEIVQAYIDVGKGGNDAFSELWKQFGKKTIRVMQDGTHLLAVFWESAWAVGDGERKVTRKSKLSHKEAMDIVQDPDFLPSMSIGKIGELLKKN